MKHLKIVLILLALLPGRFSHAQTYNVVDFGAVPNAKTLNTQAIQKAIDKCAETGGLVYFPKGTFLSGTIFLRSNVTLHLSPMAVLKGSPLPQDYPDIFKTLPPGETTGTPATKIRNPDTQRRCQVGFVVAQNVHHVGIEGTGTIDGNGMEWTGSKENDGPNRPNCVLFIYCEDVLVKDFTLKNSVNWATYYLKCNRVNINRMKINSLGIINNDGLDIESSNVSVSDCIIESDDDGICLKSSDYEPIENISITNCVIKSNCNGIKFGTASLGGFKNVSISNCVISKVLATRHWPWNWHKEMKDIELPVSVLAGLALELVDGGTMENITITNISMRDVQTAIFVHLGNRARREKPTDPVRPPGVLKNVIISNVNAISHSKITNSISGQPGYPVENIQLSNIQINSMGKGTAEEASMPVPERAAVYPEQRMFGYSLPAHGFYLRHAKNITFQNVDFQLRNPDRRPAYAFDDVKDVFIKTKDNPPFQVKDEPKQTTYSPERN
ncbi:glycoside hydrolase family 28 protein [Spirosoma areae]